MKAAIAGVAFLLGAVLSGTAGAATLEPVAEVEISGNIKGVEDLSAIVKFRDFLIIGSDEAVRAGNFIQILRKTADNRYQVHRDILLFKGNKKFGKEMDIEAIAAAGDSVFVVGSHSAVRPRIKTKSKYWKNQRKLNDGSIKRQKSRDRLYRLKLARDGKLLEKDHTSLRRIIENHPMFKTFAGIPGKENGVNIEGLAVRGDWLYVGFRGPMLRGNHVPIMKLKFDNPGDRPQTLYVDLGGRSIRGMTAVSSGFLIIAGPVGDGPGSYQLYHWDGKDALPGRGRGAGDVGHVNLLGEIPVPAGGKAEGIAVLEEDGQLYDLIILYDGLEQRVARRFRLKKQ